jgi:hypothetical protein
VKSSRNQTTPGPTRTAGPPLARRPSAIADVTSLERWKAPSSNISVPGMHPRMTGMIEVERLMAVHREEGALTIRIELSAEFAEDYEGDDDGLAWLERFRREVQPNVVRAVFESLRQSRRFDVIPVSRGRSPDENVDVEVRFKP